MFWVEKGGRLKTYLLCDNRLTILPFTQIQTQLCIDLSKYLIYANYIVTQKILKWWWKNVVWKVSSAVHKEKGISLLSKLELQHFQNEGCR